MPPRSSWEKNGNSKITTPIECYVGGHQKIVCVGHFAPKPIVEGHEPIPMVLVGSLQSIMKPNRKCVIKVSITCANTNGRSKNISLQFDLHEHLPQLSEILQTEDDYEFYVLEEQNAKGKRIFTLQRIGDAVSSTLFPHQGNEL